MTTVDVEAIRAAYPIAQVVADSGVTLRPTGHGYLGCCPFHDDTTPSLSVDGRPGRYHCFGCGASGDVIDYIARLDGVGFRDAVAHLTGMPPTPDPLPRPAPRVVAGVHDESRLAELVSRERAFAINQLAWAHYTGLARHTFAVAYLQRRRRIDVRGLEDQGGSFVVGTAGASWTDLVDALRRKDVTDEEMLVLDLAQVSSRGRLINTLRNRIIVPVHDWDQPDQIAGFIGRDTTGHPRAPKYRNPTRTPVFDKAQMLYQPSARVPGSLKGSTVVVEGPLDAMAIAAAAAAANNSSTHGFVPVSLAGTAASPTQTGRVLSLAQDADGPLVLALDADASGAAATRAWIDTLRHHPDTEALARTLVARLPAGWDPADWLAHHGAAGLSAFKPGHVGQRFGPVPPGAELVQLALAEHARTGATGADPTHAVVEALRPLATRLPTRHTRLLLATAAREMTRQGWNANHTFTRALHATGLLTPSPTREQAITPTTGCLAPALALP